MKTVSVIILFLSLCFCLFGCWGMFTNAGSREYPEMAGLIPFYTLIAGILLFIIFLILCSIRVIKRKKNS